MLKARLLACLSRALGLLLTPMANRLPVSGDAPRFLLVGLGNPGPRYRGTRHNVGAAAIEAIVAAVGTGELEDATFANVRLAVVSLGPVRVAAAVSKSYMNVCGGSIGALTRSLGLPAEAVIVLHDDLDIPPGKIKVKQGGSSGGHNGLKSCSSTIGDTFWRIRIGVGRPLDRQDVPDFVLGAIPPDQLSKMRLEAVGRLVPLLFDGEGRLTDRSASIFMNALAQPSNAVGGDYAAAPSRAGQGEVGLGDGAAPSSASAADKGAPTGLGGGCAAGEGRVGGARPVPLAVSTGLSEGASAVGLSENRTPDAAADQGSTKAASAAGGPVAALGGDAPGGSSGGESGMSDAKAKGRAMGDGEGEEGSSEREENALPPKRLKSGGGDGAAAP
jgi:PTH1 family peptidyl-tRNA hydrolase